MDTAPVLGKGILQQQVNHPLDGAVRAGNGGGHLSSMTGGVCSTGLGNAERASGPEQGVLCYSERLLWETLTWKLRLRAVHGHLPSPMILFNGIRLTRVSLSGSPPRHTGRGGIMPSLCLQVEG